MAGSEEKDGVLNPNPSPGTSISNFLDEEFGATSFSDLLAENVTEVPDPESEMKKSVSSAKGEDGVGIQLSGDDSFPKNSFSSQKSSLNAGLTERIAARTGFNAPKLNTTQIRSENMMTPSSGMCSPYLTIPHCLDSPVFLSNSMALPSPTTGKFLFGKSKERPFDDVGPESFVFKPYTESDSLCFSNVENKGSSAIEHHQQNLSIQSEHPTQKGNVQSASVKFHLQQELNIHAHFSDSYEKKDVGVDITINPRTSDSFIENKYSPSLDDQPDGVAEPIGEFSSVAASAPADDGYNWRKYGQKQVKGSEYPRSYYKCTHPSCHVRKKVERSQDGHITEIIYRGTHVHPKPCLNRRSSVSHPFGDPQFDGSENPGSQQGFEEGPLEAFTKNGNLGDWRNDSLRVPSYASGAAEFCDPSSPLQTHDGSFVESPDPVDVSSTLSNAEDEDDGATHGSVSLGCEGEEDETESKRRKSENCSVELSAASRAAREPKVVVQTTSEVDILDDGYRWRKYGQKVVKGNPNPRSYYKCTSQGCKVRKHVERASHDLKSVITTYEGKHNHEVPAARNSSSNHPQQSTMSVPQVHGHNWRPEPNQDNFMKFDMHMAPRGAFALHGKEERRPSASFGFGMPQQGFGITGMSSMAPMKSVDFSPAYLFMGGHRRAAEAAYMMPKGEMKDESFREPGSKEAPVHHQMMGRFPLGP